MFAHDAASEHPVAGERCPTCERRVPHPKKESSPTSSAKSYRVPADERDAHDEVVEAALAYIGADGLPFALFKFVTVAAVAVLQDPELRDFYRRAA